MMEFLFAAYFPVVIGNPVVSLICLIAGPRSWSRKLCRLCLWTTGIFLVAVAGFLAELAVSTGLRDEGGFGFGLVVMGCIPVVIEFIALLAIQRVRLRPTPAH